MSDNTLFLRLAGPMQSWGTSSRFQLRRTDGYPSKSGVLGLLLCARGVRREVSASLLKPLSSLTIGVRVDRPGTLDWDYHTAGGGHGSGVQRAIGIRSAEGKIKKTASTDQYETLLSRRQYLYDASFLVALQGPMETINDCATALDNPVWPLFLGRKCCVPAEPVFVGIKTFDTMTDALSSVPWRPRIDKIDGNDHNVTRTLDAFIEHPAGSPPPAEARLVYDVPQVYGFYSYGARWVVPGTVMAPVGEATQKSHPDTRRGDPYSKHFKEVARPSRLKVDNYLCVFCKSPAEEVHHVEYKNAGHETDVDLRSLCKVCHAACTMLEYGRDMQALRVDPSDPAHRQDILNQIDRNLKERRLGRWRRLLDAGRAIGPDFFDSAPGSSPREGY